MDYVIYEHSFEGKNYTYTPEQEINYLYRKHWNEPDYKKDASLEYMMKYLVKKGIYEPVAMYFRNPYMAKNMKNVLMQYLTYTI